MADPFTLTAIVFTFLLAGTVKGVVGMGLPAVSLALLTALLDLPTAMALMLVPSFVTNVWQAVVGGNGLALLKRLAVFFILAFAAVWLGGQALVTVDLSLLSALLGVLLVFYGATGLANSRMTVRAGQEGWAGPAIGFINGVFTGMTGSFAFSWGPLLAGVGSETRRAHSGHGNFVHFIDGGRGDFATRQRAPDGGTGCLVSGRAGAGNLGHGVWSAYSPTHV